MNKIYAAVVQSTCPSQNERDTPTSDNFGKLRCRKSAHRRGSKHMSKSKCTKHANVGPLLEVVMSKSAHCCGAKHSSKSECTNHTNSEKCSKSAHRCGAKQISTSKVHKTDGHWPLLDVQKSFCVEGARGCAPGQKWAERKGLAAVSTTHYTPPHSTS